MELSLINSQVGALNLSDETGISVQSKKSISIYAKKGVMFSAAGVHIATPVGGEVKFIKCCVGGEMVSSSLILSNNYDIKTKKVTLAEGRVHRKNLAYNDGPKIASQDNHDFLSQLVGNAIFGFFAVGALAIVGVLAASIAGVALATVGVAAAFVMGATAIGAVVSTAQDAIAGEARSLGEATLDMIGWGLQGLMFFVGGTAFMGLKSIVSAAPYIGQLTSRQIIATMLGNGAVSGVIGGSVSILSQTIQLLKDNGIDYFLQLKPSDYNWDDVKSSIRDGAIGGITSGSKLTAGWLAVFSAAYSAQAEWASGEDAGKIIASAFTSGVITAFGGNGILAARIMSSQILDAIKDSAKDTFVSEMFSEIIDAVIEKKGGPDSTGEESDSSMHPKLAEGAD